MLGARADTCKARSADVFTGAAGDIVNAALAAPLGCIEPRWSGLS